MHFPGPKIQKKGGAKSHPPKIGGQEPPVMLVELCRHFEEKKVCQLKKVEENIT